jgi:TPR repeat protein
MSGFPDEAAADVQGSKALSPGEAAAEPSRVDKLGGALSGTIVGIVVGGVGALLANGTWQGGQMFLACLAGGVMGAFVGWKTAAIATIWGGALLGAFIPVGLCLLEVLRRLSNLRLQAAEFAREFANPNFYVGAACVLGGFALFGAILVGLRKVIVHLLQPNSMNHVSKLPDESAGGYQNREPPPPFGPASGAGPEQATAQSRSLDGEITNGPPDEAFWFPNSGTNMRNTKFSLAAFLALLLWSGFGWTQEPSQDTNSKRAKELMEQGATFFRAKDFAAAAPLFLDAARLGHPGAQLQIGWHYRYGKGVPRNPREAVRWYARSAQQGNAIAQRNLGSMYEDGEGVREDWIEAARWYGRSAKQNYPGGLVALARAYMFGIGVPQSRAKAVELYTRAAAQGDNKAAHWARYYRNPTNASLRTEGERQIIGLMPTVVPWDPAGRRFRNSAERSAFLRGQRRSGEYTNAQALYLARKLAYDNELRAYNEGKRLFPPVAPIPPSK